MIYSNIDKQAFDGGEANTKMLIQTFVDDPGKSNLSEKVVQVTCASLNMNIFILLKNHDQSQRSEFSMKFL